VEQSGANIVMDDLCVGSRHSWHDVELTPDPMDGIVARYLEKIPCPVICWDWAGSHRASIEKRFGHLKDYVKEYNVNGAILYYLMRCDNHAFCIPDLRDYLEEMGLQVLCIEDDYSLTTMGRYRTMVQALVETISAR
jgi:benzoyl-CoA reductase/2-hydroxyglutaryl-CoA dehydratase subunit BcrC/BadD/HgdB